MSEEMTPGDEVPPDTYSAGEDACERCDGTGEVDGGTCPDCGGSGKVVEAIGGG
jgi:DnaJ-class molecular chaperone